MISKEQFLTMHELRRQGVTIKRIAEQYRLDRSTVSGTKNVTLKGGRVFGKLADATASVDLSAAAIVLLSSVGRANDC